MNRYSGLVLASALLVATVSRAQDVAYEKYQLQNGLTVILHQDHSAPIACVNLWFKVGSKDEAAGRSGFAHLFEHLMFMGTQRAPGNVFDTLMEARGGQNNASTSEDRTNYYEIGPAELLPTLLWLEADRMQALGKATNQEKLDRQREVVLNERRQSSENEPYGRAELRIPEAMYPPGHPYHISVIGLPADLKAATVDDVRSFFATYYAPNNASLVVAGDFDPAAIKPLIDKLFGTLPRGSDVSSVQARPASIAGAQRVTMTDAVQLPRTTMVFHSVPFYAPGDADLDVLASILADGVSSRLYQRLIYQQPLAVDVRAYQASMKLGSLFRVEVMARPDADLGAIEKAVDEELAKIRAKGPTAAEVERVKSKIEHDKLDAMQHLLAKADALNNYQDAFGEPNSFKRDLDRYRAVSTASVQRLARQTLTPEARLILRVLPELSLDGADPRDQRPDERAASDFVAQAPTQLTLRNGISVLHWQRRELPLAKIWLLLPRGGASDPAGQAGLIELTAQMLDEGAGRRSATQFADELGRLGARLEPTVWSESTAIELSVLARNARPALALLADAVMRPHLDEKEWQRVRQVQVETLRSNLDQPSLVARQVALRALFGDRHPYGRPVEGTVASASTLQLTDVKRAFGQLARPDGAVFLVAGDLSADETKRLLDESFGDWTAPAGGQAAPAPQFPDVGQAAQRVVIVHRPDAVQTSIALAMPGFRYADPARTRLWLLSTILGGSFTSRLNFNLREQHGYTYGAYGGHELRRSGGVLFAATEVQTEVTGAAISELLKEFARLRSGDVTADETIKAKALQRMQVVETLALLEGTLGTAVQLVRNGRRFDEIRDDLTAIAAATPAELNQLAAKSMPLERSVLVLVGDRKQILEQLKGLNLPKPIELSVTGDPMTAK